jgi:hypothetical protein
MPGRWSAALCSAIILEPSLYMPEQRSEEDFAGAALVILMRLSQIIVRGHMNVAVFPLDSRRTDAFRACFVSGPNPAHSIETVRGDPRDRILSPEEMTKLGKTLRESSVAHRAI